MAWPTHVRPPRCPGCGWPICHYSRDRLGVECLAVISRSRPCHNLFLRLQARPLGVAGRRSATTPYSLPDQLDSRAHGFLGQGAAGEAHGHLSRNLNKVAARLFAVVPQDYAAHPQAKRLLTVDDAWTMLTFPSTGVGVAGEFENALRAIAE